MGGNRVADMNMHSIKFTRPLEHTVNTTCHSVMPVCVMPVFLHWNKSHVHFQQKIIGCCFFFNDIWCFSEMFQTFVRAAMMIIIFFTLQMSYQTKGCWQESMSLSLSFSLKKELLSHWFRSTFTGICLWATCAPALQSRSLGIPALYLDFEGWLFPCHHVTHWPRIGYRKHIATSHWFKMKL